MNTLNSYLQFFEKFPKEDFFQFGLENIITPSTDAVSTEWQSIIDRIESKSSDLYVRKFGQNGTGNELLSRMYNDLLSLDINFDPTNNMKPRQLIQNLTGRLKTGKSPDVVNYQVAHVFGRTKNVYCFTAPWNIAYVPKIIDPLTGHEAKGDFVTEFQSRFFEKFTSAFKEQIDQFNSLMEGLQPEVIEWLDRSECTARRRNHLINEFSPIEM